MSNTVYGQQVIPSASRLMKSLRDLGYDFSQAVADLVDNSIEAGSTKVIIDVEFDGDHSRVRIADNGKGMSLPELQEAMRYGSERDYEEIDGLGKFGLGLKTASLSQCQRLSVASRDDRDKEFNACCWDLEHVEKTNKWELINPDKKNIQQILGNGITDSTGTVVLWQWLDRMLGMKHPYGEVARKRLMSMCRDLENHLAMVFHRFLDGEVPGKTLEIILNGNKIEPWDPYARGEPKTKVLDPIHIPLEYEGVSGEVILEPFVLPHQDDFSSRDAFNRTSGPAKWNQQQGFYIYRSDRLIQSGGWSKLQTVDEHTKLARLALRFTSQLDDAFKINVAKMRVQLPTQIRDQISDAIKPVIKLAQETYRRTGQKPAGAPSTKLGTQAPPPPFQSSGGSPSHSGNQPSPYSENQQPSRLWKMDELQSLLECIAEPEEKPVIARVFNRFRRKLDS